MPRSENSPVPLAEVEKSIAHWQLSSAETASLLGLVTTVEQNEVQDIEIQPIERPETKERILLIESINRSLNVLYGNETLVRNWLRSPNSHELFNGETALAVMCGKSVHRLERVAALLAAWSAGN